MEVEAEQEAGIETEQYFSKRQRSYRKEAAGNAGRESEESKTVETIQETCKEVEL